MGNSKLVESRCHVAVRNILQTDMKEHYHFASRIPGINLKAAHDELVDMPFCYESPGDEIVLLETLVPQNKEDRDLLTNNGY